MYEQNREGCVLLFVGNRVTLHVENGLGNDQREIEIVRSMCVSVCVRERERERESAKMKKTFPPEREKENIHRKRDQWHVGLPAAECIAGDQWTDLLFVYQKPARLV